MNEISFRAARFFDVTEPSAIADFNGDGIDDRIALDRDGNTITILLGQGDGTFDNGIDYAVGTSPETFTIDDFDDDGNLDIAVANSFFDNDVSLLFGNGDGTFSAAPTFDLGGQPRDVVVGDFNDDGIADLATPNRFSDFASVLIGQGDGTFADAVNYTVGDFGTAIAQRLGFAEIAIGEVNGDGIEDLIIGREDSISVLLGREDGTFADSINTEDFTTFGFFSSVTAADFNNDNLDDLAFANSQSQLSILLSNGDGTFAINTVSGIGRGFNAPTAVDFNGDGNLDLAVADYYSGDDSDSVSILLGNGNGTFANAVKYTVGEAPGEIDTGDFNGDGVIDLAVANVFSYFVSVLIGEADGTFNPANNIDLGSSRPNAVTVEDIDGDGIEDLVVAQSGNDDIIILQGQGDGNFIPGESFASGAFDLKTVTTADFNNDGNSDVAAVRDSDVSILLNQGNGSLQSTLQIEVPGTTTLGVAGGDINGDGVSDLAVADGNVSLLLSNGNRTFSDPIVETVVNTSTDVAIEDVSGDGIADLIVTSAENVDQFEPRNGRNGKVSILLGNGDATFNNASVKDIGGKPQSIAIGDVNDDGIVDLVIGNLNDDRVSVLLGNGNGNFQNRVDYNVSLPREDAEDIGTFSIDLELSDFDDDGNIDIIASNSVASIVLTGNGDGTFLDTPAIETSLGGISSDDIDEDGFDDLIGLQGGGSIISVLISQGDGNFTDAIQSDFEVYGYYYKTGSTIGDFNGDGILDVAATEYYSLRYGFNARVALSLGNGDGTFGDPVRINEEFNSDVSGLISGDFNGDGLDDIAISQNVYEEYYSYYFEFIRSKVSVLLNNNDGTFDQVSTDISDREEILGAIDLNGDGIDDIISDEAIRFGKGDGTFEESVAFSGGDFVASGDFNNDGLADLVTAAGSFDNRRVSVLLNDGNNTFTQSTELAVDGNFDSEDISVADYDGDGLEDIALSGLGENNIAILVSKGDGTFQDAVKFAVEDVRAIASGDFENNGSNDIAVASRDKISILLNNTSNTEEDLSLFGTSEGDIFNGMGGNDTIVGFRGNDSLALVI